MNSRTAFIIFIVLAFMSVGGTYLALQYFRELSRVETTLFHIMTWGIGLCASYVFAMIATRSSARQEYALHARASFRRVLGLHNSLFKLSEQIESLRAQELGGPNPRLDLLQALVHEQIATVQASVEDWRDIVPDEVEQVEVEIRRAQNASRG